MALLQLMTQLSRIHQQQLNLFWPLQPSKICKHHDSQWHICSALLWEAYPLRIPLACSLEDWELSFELRILSHIPRKRKQKVGHHSSRKRLCSTQNRVTDVHDTLAVCYERASVSSYDSIRYKRTPMWLQNGAIYVLWLTPSKDKWSSIKLAHISLSVSQATGTMADSVRMSSDIRPIGAEKFRTIRFFFGQWPKGRP